MTQRLSVVIPAFNEEQGIGPLLDRLITTGNRIQELFPVIADVEVIVVDDGSTDATRTIVARFPHVKLIRHAANKGYGAALKTGFSNATGDYMAFLDADATNPPEALPDLVRPIVEGRADVVVGTRVSDKDGGMPKIRTLGN